MTKLSWRTPITPNGQVVAKGPFTCPFCEGESPLSTPEGGSPAPSAPVISPLPAPVKPAKVEVALIGEGSLTVSTFDAAAGRYTPVDTLEAERVPIKGGLNRNVPASYQMSVDAIAHPLKIEITGAAAARDTSLQVTGPGYTAAFEGLTLSPQVPLTLYVYPQETGPELTFVAQQSTAIPKLVVSLEDFSTESAPGVDAETTASQPVSRTQNVSYSFTVSGVNLPAGKAVAIAVDRNQKRFYFGDNDAELDDYRLYVESRTREEAVTLTETRRDYPDGTYEIDQRTERRISRYFESLEVPRVQMAAQGQAYFDYGSWAVAPSSGAGEAALEAAVNVPIYYGSITARSEPGRPLILARAAAPGTARLYQGYLLQSDSP
ncbi:MAG: hypothetical protein ICV62_04190 [Cyanobacteria bacterium Co-bin13]|nr:hypothetical protein [Cyanobacteria bacterium Co-bin13]